MAGTGVAGTSPPGPRDSTSQTTMHSNDPSESASSDTRHWPSNASGTASAAASVEPATIPAA